jgi:hypothetical protein
VGTPLAYGTAWVMWAIQEMPAIRNITMAPWVTRSCRALRPSGGRSALTALDTASIPVSDDPPLANARASVKIAAKVIRPPVPCPIETVPECQVTCGRPPPKISRASPTMIIRPTDPEKR